MSEFNTIQEILDFAIGEEQAAVDFYLKLAAQSKNSQTRKVFQEFAEEEIRHKANLTAVREGGRLISSGEKVTDLRISDYLVDVRALPDLPYQEALILAMKKEKAAFRMYNALADRTDDREMKDLFLALAQEESKHKLRFEVEYDDYILKEN